MKKHLFTFIALFLIGFSLNAQTNKMDEAGKRHGVWKGIYETSKRLRYEGTFNHGKETGTFKFFDDNENVNAGTEILDTTTGLAGKAIIYYTIDKDEDSEYWVLQGVKVKDNEFLLSTICYPTEKHKAWAIETWTSIKK